MKKTLLLISLVFLIAGWSSTPTDVSTEKLSDIPHIAQEYSRTSPAASPQFKLLDAGTEPRQKLRLNLTEYSQETSQMTMNMNMTVSVDGQTKPKFYSPTTGITIEVQVTKVDDNGDIYADFSYTDVDVVANTNTSPELVDAMRSQMNQLVGLNGSWIMDNQGNTKDASFILPENLDANSKQMLESMLNSLKQISSPLPSEAVGIGAQWQVANSLNVNGINLEQIANYELVNLQDNVIILDVTIEQEAGSQKINPPGLPAGASVNLTFLDAQGSGKMTIALDKIMPISATMSVDSNMNMKVREAGSTQETTIGTNTSMEVSLESK
ncbi:MAG: hypothetical protein AB4426_26470 [Xenococcaceae cyanobacterium]